MDHIRFIGEQVYQQSDDFVENSKSAVNAYIMMLKYKKIEPLDDEQRKFLRDILTEEDIAKFELEIAKINN